MINLSDRFVKNSHVIGAEILVKWEYNAFLLGVDEETCPFLVGFGCY